MMVMMMMMINLWALDNCFKWVDDPKMHRLIKLYYNSRDWHVAVIFLFDVDGCFWWNNCTPSQILVVHPLHSYTTLNIDHTP